MTITKEEHARRQRRLRRQILGGFVALLALIGIFSLIGSGVKGIKSLFDQTDEYAAYEERLEGFVMFDPVPFDGLENIDDTVLHSAAVWGALYNLNDSETGLDAFSRDPDTDKLMLPVVEVDAYLARVAGPDFKMVHHTFTCEDMDIEYDETNQCYLIPVTGSVGYYTPTVTAIFKQSGKLYVTVGYIPVESDVDLTSSSASETPTKYMDYVFSRTHGNWYLTGLTESATKPEATEAPASGETFYENTDEAEKAIVEGAGVESTPESTEETAASEGEAAESTAESEAESSSN